MKSISFLLLSFLLIAAAPADKLMLKPYTVGVESTKSISEMKTKVEAALKAQQIRVIGRTKPAKDVNRLVLAVTSTDLDNAVKKTGGLTGFGSVLRIAITRESGKTVVSYTTPEYWGNAYFRKQYPSVASHYSTFHSKLKKAFTSLGTYSGKSFGSKEGLSSSKLRDYQYMMGMPEFDDTEVLKKFSSHQAAVAKIDANLKAGVTNVRKVYKHKVPGHNITIYGLALSGSTGEGHFLKTIDIGKPKHTAFLPYEILVVNDKVHMLHGRYRIALSFPDLTMGTFMKIMSTPDDIEELMTKVVN